MSCECCFDYGLNNNLYRDCLELLPYVLDKRDKYKLCKWMKECSNEYLIYASNVVDLEYHYFEYEANYIKQREMIALIISRVLIFGEMIDIWKVIYKAMWW